MPRHYQFDVGLPFRVSATQAALFFMARDMKPKDIECELYCAGVETWNIRQALCRARKIKKAQRLKRMKLRMRR